MKNKVDKLYLAKIRSCIMDIVMTFVSDGKVIEPRPDYFEYYTILIRKNEGDLSNLCCGLFFSYECIM